MKKTTELLPSGATRDVGGEALKDLNNASLESAFANYEGTESAIKTKFALEHNGDPIFKKPYDGSTSEVVNVTANTITLTKSFLCDLVRRYHMHIQIEELACHLLYK